MDVCLISEFSGGQQHYRAVHGDAAMFGLTTNGASPTEPTYCQLMVQGAIPNVIPDLAADSRVSHLASGGVFGAYAGVPLRYSDGTLYGTFCCLSRDTEPHLGERDAQFMAMLAELLTEDLDAERDMRITRERISDVIEHERLALALQPITDLTTGRCVGVEALSRFEIGRPDEVFALADEVGLALPLERLAVRKAISLLPTLGQDQYLAINVTPAAAIALAAVAADEPGQPLDQLVMEITEHASVQDYRALRERLEPLRQRGLRVAIDDAGAGFASLHHIVELHPDIIKIDRSLIAGLAQDKARRSIVTAFVLLALDLDATLVAEGVETSDELAAATALGVDTAQGYLIARPSIDPKDHAAWRSSPNLLSGL
jgi:EAL domain-containing protein (putative c-di-GMP-specific phosphodiesterase class I)